MLQTRAPSPVSARRAQSTPSSASNTSISSSSSHQQQSEQQQQQQQHQQKRIPVLPPAIAAFKVLQPAKDLLEQTWKASIAAVQQEFAVVQADLARSARERQALTELLQRIQADRVQAVHALHNSQNELRQCIGQFQSERRIRVHLERKLAEVTHFMEKCTCGAAQCKISPTTSTTTPPSPPVVLPDMPPSTVSSPTSAPAPAPTPMPVTEPCSRTPTPAPTPGPGPDSSSPSPSSSSSSPASGRKHKREDDVEDGEIVEPKRRRRIERAPTGPTPEAVVIDTASADKTLPAAKLIAESPEQQEEEPKTPLLTPQHKIGMQHIQLVYETVGSTLQCRMCLLQKREVDSSTRVATFPLSAAYTELVEHCEMEHDAALKALACMSLSEVAEMHQRFRAAQR